MPPAVEPGPAKPGGGDRPGGAKSGERVEVSGVFKLGFCNPERVISVGDVGSGFHANIFVEGPAAKASSPPETGSRSGSPKDLPHGVDGSTDSRLPTGTEIALVAVLDTALLLATLGPPLIPLAVPLMRSALADEVSVEPSDPNPPPSSPKASPCGRSLPLLAVTPILQSLPIAS